MLIDANTDTELVIKECVRQIEARAGYNRERARWYDGKELIKSLGLSMPANLGDRVQTVLGWPALVVDALEERLDINGFVSPGAVSVLDEVGAIWAANNLDVEYSQAHLEALIHGVAFLCATPGGPGDPTPTITVESPLTMTGIWDPVRRELEAAAAVRVSPDGRPVAATVYTRFDTRLVQRTLGRWVEVERHPHRLGRVPVRRLVNRARTGRVWGSSEITPSIISATRSTVRTLVRAEIGSEYFAVPQLVGLGLADSDFAPDLGGGSVSFKRWMSSMLLIPDLDEPDYQRPDVKQLPAASPQPFIDLIRMYSQLVAGEAALPPAYLGFETANPSSADQIRAIEARHVKRAERKQRVFGKAWAGIMRDGIELVGGSSEGLYRLAVNWADASTPTRAATTDAVVKQIQAGALPATSAVTYEQLGYDSTTIARLVADARLAEAAAQVNAAVMVPIDEGVRTRDETGDNGAASGALRDTRNTTDG